MGILLALMIINVLFYFLVNVNVLGYQLSTLLIRWLEICSIFTKNITSNLENNLQTPNTHRLLRSCIAFPFKGSPFYRLCLEIHCERV